MGSLLIQGGLRLARLLSLIVAAYYLSNAAFAALAISLAATDLARSALLAFDVAAVRDRSRTDSAIRSLTAAKLACAASLGCMTTGAAAVAYGEDVGRLAAILALGLVPYGMASLWMVPRQVEMRLLELSPAVVAASIITVIAALLGAMTSDPAAVSVGLVVGDVALLGFVSLGTRYRPDWNRAGLARSISEAPRLMIQQLGYAGQFRVGTLLLGLLASPLAVAEYSIASRAAEGLVIVSTALIATSYPLMADAFANKDDGGLERRFTHSYRLAVGLSIALVSALVLSVSIWLPVTFPRYPGASIPFVLVGGSVVLFFASGQTTALLNACKRDTAAATSAAAGLAMTVVGTLILGPIGGSAGAGVARLAGDGVRLAVETRAIWRARILRMRRALLAWLAMSPLIIACLVSVAMRWSTDLIWIGALLGTAGSAAVVSMVRRHEGGDAGRHD